MRTPAALVVVFLALVCSVAAQSQSLADILSANLDIERELLAEDLRLYAAARGAQERAQSEIEATLAALDQEIDGRTVSVERFENLEGEYATARERWSAVEAEARSIRQRLYDRLRRTALLSARIDQLRGTQAVQVDPVSGTWRLSLSPQRSEGSLVLRLAGTLVTGTYELEDKEGGSLRGTYSGGKLRLERIDARRGFDSVWEGELDPARRRIEGTWTAVELSSGGPARGSWTAEKIEPRGAVGSISEETP